MCRILYKNISKIRGYIFWVSEVKGQIKKNYNIIYTNVLIYNSYMCMFIGFPMIYGLFL